MEMGIATWEWEEMGILKRCRSTSRPLSFATCLIRYWSRAISHVLAFSFPF